jgi:ceramide glucosyltransferase
VNFVLLAASLASLGYLVLACAKVTTFALRRRRHESSPLSFTIIKPVAGDEPGLYENLASFCEQEYPGNFNIVFCVHDANDPAMPTLERLIESHRWCSLSIAVGNNAAMSNPKIANIAKPNVELRGTAIVVADSDIRVGPRYLRALASGFADERVGAVTCLYTGIPNRSLVSRLGALGIDDGFAPSVLVATALGPLRFCLGATMAIRRELLERIGGFAAVGNDLADDHRLGQLVAGTGASVALSRYVVATTVPETRLGALLWHEVRWARTQLSLAPVGYCFSFLMYALPLTLIYFAVARNIAWGLPLVAVAVFLRLLLHVLARGAFKVRGADDLWLIPVRDFLSLGVWCTSLLGRTVRWRERRYHITNHPARGQRQ